MRLFGDGRQTRDFIHVQNVVEANILAATKEGVPTTGEVFNIAGGREITLLELLAEINALAGTAIEPIHEAARAGDVRFSCADISRARERMGFASVVDFREGLRRTIEWYREQVG